MPRTAVSTLPTDRSTLQGGLQRQKASRVRFDRLAGGRYIEFFHETRGVTVSGRQYDTEDDVRLMPIGAHGSITGRVVKAALLARGIECRPLWRRMHMQAVFAWLDGRIIGAAARLHRDGISLPSGWRLGAAQTERAREASAPLVLPT